MFGAKLSSWSLRFWPNRCMCGESGVCTDVFAQCIDERMFRGICESCSDKLRLGES